MMRVLEPELMTLEAPVAAYAGADLTEINQAIIDCFQARFPDFRGSYLLDLGCGAADVSIRFAKAYPGIKILGVDGSGTMLEEARRAVQRTEYGDRIRLARYRLPDERLPRGSFDAVVANSVLHHLEDSLSLWRTVFHCAKPGAAVMVVDLCRPHSVEEAEALVLRYAGEAAPLLQNDFFHSLCAAYRADEVREQLKHAGLHKFEAEHLGDLQLVVWGTTAETQVCVR
jgi:cyclopropane fatty-acyl-phospholipid synthase-like methyltransferase